MIQQPQYLEEELSLFEQPEQLILLKQNLILLIKKYEQTKNNHDHMDPHRDVDDAELKQKQNTNYLLHKIEQNKQQISELTSQMHTVAEITTKMVDYIIFIQEKRVQQIGLYEAEIQNLKGQLQHATHQNHIIEGDIEEFKQKLRFAQSQIQDIQRNQQQKQNNQVQDIENQRKIQVLEQQLQMISQQLNAYKVNYTQKQPQIGSLDRIISYNMSQKLFKLKRMTSAISSPYIHGQETVQLQQKISFLQQENKILRQEIESLRQNGCQYQLESEDYYQQNQSLFQEYSTPPTNNLHSLNKLTSTSFLKSTNKQQSQISSQNMVSHQSIQKFHILSSEWNSKSFENNLCMFNMESHSNDLIYLGNDEEEKFNNNKIAQSTKQTENSLVDSELNLLNKQQIKTKYVTEIGINTDISTQPQRSITENIVQTKQNFIIKKKQDNPQKTLVESLLQMSLRDLTAPLLNLKKRAVQNRINKCLHALSRKRGI